MNFYIYIEASKKQKNVWKLKKTKVLLSKKKKSDIELNKNLYPKDKNQILSEAKPEGDYSPPLIYPLIKLEGFVSICLYLLKKKLDSRTVFSQTKSLESQMGKRWYEYENGKLGIILSKNI